MILSGKKIAFLGDSITFGACIKDITMKVCLLEMEFILMRMDMPRLLKK